MSKRKPTKLKILEGNPGKRPLNKNEPEPIEANVRELDPPEWMLEEAKKEWARIVPELLRLSLFTKIDRTALVGYCQSWARYIEAEEFLSNNATTFETDKGYIAQVPQVSIAQKYLKLCHTFMTEFGFTPSSRGNINLSPGSGDEDPMDKWFKDKGI
jgi:P27 family predicted phage terminase small subunit